MHYYLVLLLIRKALHYVQEPVRLRLHLILRTHGADTILVQRLLKEDIDTYIERSKISANCRIH